MPTTVRIQKQGDMVKAWIDGEALSFGPGNEAVIAVSGKSHALTWIVIGAPGEKYTIKLTSPTPAVFEHSATLDADMKDAGLHWFSVES